MEFIRWGSLAPQKHKYHWGNKPKLSFQRDGMGKFMRQFFIAPKDRGIYAFPLGLHDKKLLYGGGSLATGRYRYLKDANGHKIMVRPMDYYDDTFDEWWLWSISYCSYSITPYYRSLLTKMGVDPRNVMIYSEKDGRYDPRIWLHEAYLDANYEPNSNEDTNVDLKITYPLVVENKPKRFNYEGRIWHHFDTTYPKREYEKRVVEEWNQLSPQELKERSDDGLEFYLDEDFYDRTTYTTLVEHKDIMDRKGTWILTDMDVFRNALKKATGIYKHDRMQWLKDFQGGYSGLPRDRFITGDFEVFIEKVK
ncbi:MAG: hypothetical protein IKH01_06705 [Prevotella sp.]|nr:hypothetical protein [Prevotella sp.]